MTLRCEDLSHRIRSSLPLADEGNVRRLGEGLHAAWSEPGRAYHNLQHLSECLDWLDQAPVATGAVPVLTLALLFHDAIYDARAHDNEARSAEWAGRALAALEADIELINAVYQLILATRTHESGGMANASLMLDIDLAILGAEPERFADYEAGIREEYGFVPESEFQIARGRVMRDFARRPRLYLNDFFHQRLDAAARRNLASYL